MRLSRQILKKQQTFYFTVMVVFGFLYFIMAISNHYFFRSVSFDYGTYNYDYWNLAHFRIGCNPVYNDSYNICGNTFRDHFSLMLFYLLPFYWLFGWLTGTYTLLIIQELFVLLAGWCIYRLVILKTEDRWLGVLALLYYFLLHGHYSAFSSDFNSAIVCAALIPLFLYSFESNRTKASVFLLCLSLVSREDMPLYFIFILFALIIWHHREKTKVRFCLYGIAACLIYFVLVFVVFIPLTETKDSHYFLFQYAALGDTPWQAFVYILNHPLRALELLFINHSGEPENNYIKADFYFVYMASGAFVAFFRPRYLIWFIPILAQKMYNDSIIRWSIEGYYSIFIVTLLPLSVFFTIPELYNKVRARRMGVLVCILAAAVTLFVENGYKHTISWINIRKENIFNPIFFYPGYNASEIHSLLKQIPPDAAVCASESLLPHLAWRKDIYKFPYYYNAQYIAVFSFHDYYKISRTCYADSLVSLIKNPQWRMIGYSYPFMLFKKENSHNSTSSFFWCDKPDMPVNNIHDFIVHTRLRLMLVNDTSILLEKEDLPISSNSAFNCDAESISPDGKNLLTSCNKYIGIGGDRTDFKAHSGKYSVKLSAEKPFGMNCRFTDLTPGDVIRISIWRYSPEEKGRIVVCTDNNSIYHYSNKVTEHNGSGWEKLYFSMIVPPDCRELKLYAWSEGGISVYFDDLEVQLYKNISF